MSQDLNSPAKTLASDIIKWVDAEGSGWLDENLTDCLLQAQDEVLAKAAIARIERDLAAYVRFAGSALDRGDGNAFHPEVDQTLIEVCLAFQEAIKKARKSA